MSHKNGKRLGFIGALAMLIGSVVGIGIFFKSHGILRANDWSGTGTFLAWLFGGILSLGAAVSFSEIGSLKTKSVSGLPAWAEKFGGKKFGYFVRFNWSFFYYGLLAAVLGVFGSEMIFALISTLSNGKYVMSDFPIYAHIILGFAFIIMFLTFNYFSLRGSGVFQTVATVLKWIPLVTVAVVGIIFATTNNVPNPFKVPPTHMYSNIGKNAFSNGKSFSVAGMLAALPAVLFAFDAFLGVASMRNKMDKPNKLPGVVLVGMISVIILYLAIALAAILHGSGMVSGIPMGAVGAGIFEQVFSKNVAEIMGKITMVFLVISTLGVINGISAASVAVHEQTVKTNTVFGLLKLRTKFGDVKTLFIYIISMTVFWTLVFGIPAIILNSDSIIDGISNFPTLFMFVIYATVILLYTLKRNKIKETSKINNVLFKIAAWTAVVGIYLLIGITVFHTFLMAPLESVTNSHYSTTHWGLFAGDNNAADTVAFPSKADVPFGVGMNTLQALLLFFAMLATFIAAPFANKALTKKFENNEVYIDTFKDDKTTKVRA